MANATAPTVPEPVLLIHGTFAHHEEEVATHVSQNRWWLRGSVFAKAVNALLTPTAECAPAGSADCRVLPWWRIDAWIRNRLIGHGAANGRLPEGVFHWSGDNRESARRSAGRLLLEHLRRFDSLGRPFHVIAH